MANDTPKMTEDGLEKKKKEAHDPENELKDPHEFNNDFYSLYQLDPFLGLISSEVTKVADPNCPTAYMCVVKNGVRNELVLGYGPKFMRSLNSVHRRGVIKHELYHLILQHIFHRFPGTQENAVLWNWATDLAINSLIGKDHLPQMVLYPGRHPKNEKGENVPGPYAAFIAKTKLMQSSDYYFDELKKIRQEQDKDGTQLQISINNGMSSLDNHDKWDQINPEDMEEIKDQVNSLMEKAVKEAQRSNTWGTVPASIQEYIQKVLRREVDWKSIIHNFIGRTRSQERNSTIKRINRKLPYLFPGSKRKTIANFACFIDQSGSMADEDIALLFGELQSLATLTEIDVYHFDTEIDEKSHQRWKKGNANPTTLRTRCGGTDFNAVANFVNRHENANRWSGIIILTDGYAPTMGLVKGAKVLWVITEHGTMEAVRPGDLACKMSRKPVKVRPY